MVFTNLIWRATICLKISKTINKKSSKTEEKQGINPVFYFLQRELND